MYVPAVGMFHSWLVLGWDLGFGIHHPPRVVFRIISYQVVSSSSWCMQQSSFKKLMTKMYLISKFDVIITVFIRNIRHQKRTCRQNSENKSQ